VLSYINYILFKTKVCGIFFGLSSNPFFFLNFKQLFILLQIITVFLHFNIIQNKYVFSLKKSRCTWLVLQLKIKTFTTKSSNCLKNLGKYVYSSSELVISDNSCYEVHSLHFVLANPAKLDFS